MQNAAMILDNMIKDIVAASNNFDIDSFIPRLARFLAVPHMPNKRRFLIDWTSLLQSVPDIDMLSYLPNLLDGMMNMLSDNHTEIRTAAARTLDNFLRQVPPPPPPPVLRHASACALVIPPSANPCKQSTCVSHHRCH